MTKLKIIEITPHRLNIIVDGNTKYTHSIGEFIQAEDGYFYYKPDGFGLMSEYSLKMVLNLLKKTNKPYNDQLNEYFKNEQTIKKVVDEERESPDFNSTEATDTGA